MRALCCLCLVGVALSREARADADLAPPPAAAAMLTLGTLGLGIELQLDVIPYVQLGVGGTATFEKERARMFAHGRFPISRKNQAVAGLAYHRGYYSQQSECGFLDHSCTNEQLAEGPMRSVQLEAGIMYTTGHFRMSVMLGVERLLSDRICYIDMPGCPVEKTTGHATVGFGVAFF